MRVSLIVAAAENGVIGRENGLPWRLSADLQRFKRLTMGHHLLVGRKTWDSIGRVLPGRTMLVLTRAEPDLPDGARAVRSLEEALDIASSAGDPELFVGGGGQVYELTLPRADRVYLTRVATESDGDTRFSALNDEWILTSAESHPADEKNEHAHSFEIWERTGGS